MSPKDGSAGAFSSKTQKFCKSDMQLGCKVHEPTGILTSHQHLQSCFLDTLPPLFLCNLVSPSPGSPKQHHFLCFVCAFIKFRLIFPISFIHYFWFIIIYSFNKYLLSSSHVPDIIIGTENIAVNKTYRNRCPYRVTLW